MTLLLVQYCCVHFTDDATKAQKANGEAVMEIRTSRLDNYDLNS